MSALSILAALIKGGMTPKAACAMGGNMMTESGMQANIVQQAGLAGLPDDQYTTAADAGTIDFVNDAVGYGLCQWTDPARKEKLYNFAKALGKSIGDEAMQVQFCLVELQTEHSELWNYLCTEHEGYYIDTERICKEYEQPEVNNVSARFRYAKSLYERYGKELEALRRAEGGLLYKEDDSEPLSYIMGTVRYGDHTPEAIFMMAQLKRAGYEVMWDGLTNCLSDFQQKRGLEEDGICGEKTWRELLK